MTSAVKWFGPVNVNQIAHRQETTATFCLDCRPCDDLCCWYCFLHLSLICPS